MDGLEAVKVAGAAAGLAVSGEKRGGGCVQDGRGVDGALARHAWRCQAR